jgi:hypothetical protein
LWVAHNPTNDLVAIAYIIIVITAATALAGPDKVKLVSAIGHPLRPLSNDLCSVP